MDKYPALSCAAFTTKLSALHLTSHHAAFLFDGLRIRNDKGTAPIQDAVYDVALNCVDIRQWHRATHIVAFLGSVMYYVKNKYGDSTDCVPRKPDLVVAWQEYPDSQLVEVILQHRLVVSAKTSRHTCNPEVSVDQDRDPQKVKMEYAGYFLNDLIAALETEFALTPLETVALLASEVSDRSIELLAASISQKKEKEA